MMQQLLITNIGQLATPRPTAAEPLAGQAQGDLCVIEDAYIRVEGACITDVGSMAKLDGAGGRGVQLIDAEGGTAVPGLVDPHTHACFEGWRVDEFTARLKGATYAELLEAGGGILSTMRTTRAASRTELLQSTLKHLDEMLRQGTTTVEIKSGYGLTVEHELRQLQVIETAAERHLMAVVPTFMGAHAVPPEFEGDAEGYVDYVVEEMLPSVAESGLAEFVDVFCEPGVFTVHQARRILETARELGLGLRLHADELESSGGAVLAAELGTASADHLLAAGTAGLQALSSANSTVAVLLPGTALMLGADSKGLGRKLVDEQIAVALATDFNPGSSPISSMLFMVALGSLTMGLTPAEALTASTYNAAFSLGLTDRGVLAPGYLADILLLDIPGFEHIAYRPGVNHQLTVVRRGRVATVSCGPGFPCGAIRSELE
jgi:imidazolonepropionase